MTVQLLVLNGPNLNRLDLREKSFYGDISYQDICKTVEDSARELGFVVDIRQSNDEAEIIDMLHQAADKKMPVIFNPAAFTHYSYAVRDAATMVTKGGRKLIEVHLSNPHAREEFRHTSVISGVATGVIAGFGVDSYLLALTQLV